MVRDCLVYVWWKSRHKIIKMPWELDQNIKPDQSELYLWNKIPIPIEASNMESAPDIFSQVIVV